MPLVFDRASHRYIEPQTGIMIWPTDGDDGETIIHFVDPAIGRQIDVKAQDAYAAAAGEATGAPFIGYRIDSKSLASLYGGEDAGRVSKALELIADMLRSYNRNDSLQVSF